MRHQGQSLVWLGAVILCFCLVDCVEYKTRNDAVKYFENFGYISTFSEAEDPVRFKRSVQNFQRVAGLTQTGVLDKATLQRMSDPRCGMKDDVRDIEDFQLQGGKWKKRLLTWKVENGGYKITKEQTREVFRKSTAIWSKYTNMDFKEVTSGKADILVKYGRYGHGDFYSFDGRGGVLAHAFYPYEGSEIAGDVHYDDDENFVIGSNKGTELTWVTIHELGHSLGLEHSFNRDAIMYPWYTGYQPNYDLKQDDIAGIRALYGTRTVVTRPPTTKPTTRPTTLPPTTLPPTTLSPVLPIETGCVSKVTALIQPSGSSWLLVFSGQTFSLADRYGFLRYRGLKVKSYFPRIKEEITAGLVNTATRRSLMFVPGGYYEYRGFSPAKNFQSLKTLGLPDWVRTIDAAFVWQKNKKGYFFSGTRYWRYDFSRARLDSGYPRYIRSAWKGLPSYISSATTGLDKITYFVKGSQYYVLNDWSVSVKTGYPFKLGDRWLTCANAGPGSLAVGPSSFERHQGPEGADP